MNCLFDQSNGCGRDGAGESVGGVEACVVKWRLRVEDLYNGPAPASWWSKEMAQKPPFGCVVPVRWTSVFARENDPAAMNLFIRAFLPVHTPTDDVAQRGGHELGVCLSGVAGPL